MHVQKLECVELGQPLVGADFIDCSKLYEPELRKKAMTLAGKHGVALHPAVYAHARGPQYETPAEVEAELDQRAVGQMRLGSEDGGGGRQTVKHVEAPVVSSSFMRFNLSCTC